MCGEREEKVGVMSTLAIAMPKFTGMEVHLTFLTIITLVNRWHLNACCC